MRGADCNTDHRMLRAKLEVGRRRYFRRCSGGAGETNMVERRPMVGT